MTDIRILIVEDDPFIAMDIESAVSEGLTGSQIVLATSVEDARAATQQPLSCALLDIDVVGGKTFDVAESLLAKGTPFAFVSGSSPDEVPRTLKAVPFVRKPFSTGEITGFVARAIASGTA